jgi:AhpD family alkylhydroperoxidase
MFKGITIPDSISSQENYKRKYNFSEMYYAFTQLPGASAKLIKNKRKQLISKQFIERLQLAVTEVNACAACSYAHTSMALKMGINAEEISSMLSGSIDFIIPEEAKAILFAQHFAEKRGKPEKETYQSIIEYYGYEKAEIIFAACRVMIAGNIYGLPFSALQSRKNGKPYKNSSLLFELTMLIGGVLVLPLALLHGLLKALVY